MHMLSQFGVVRYKLTQYLGYFVFDAYSRVSHFLIPFWKHMHNGRGAPASGANDMAYCAARNEPTGSSVASTIGFSGSGRLVQCGPSTRTGQCNRRIAASATEPGIIFPNLQRPDEICADRIIFGLEHVPGTPGEMGRLALPTGRPHVPYSRSPVQRERHRGHEAAIHHWSNSAKRH
jgi:hypothetical protein